MRDLPAAVRGDDQLLVLAQGLLPESPRAFGLLKDGQGLLVLPAEAGWSAGFERLDLTAAWGGAMVLPGRYADRLERRDGAWRISVRRSTVDVVMSGDASLLSAEGFADRGYHKGMRDRRDVSYQRPLTLDETPGDTW